MIYSSRFFIDFDFNKDATYILQSLIDMATREKDTLYIEKGIYNVSCLFITSNTKILMDDNAILKGTSDESKYYLLPTRVAGIEMSFYPGIINVSNANNVSIEGGIIIGAGSYYYEKYWGKDRKSGMRKEYDSMGLRWACDYDCKRVRNFVVTNSKNVTIKNITLKDSGFWNLHILYSNDILVDNVNIISDDINAPSTDGIDVDSSYDVKITNSKISVNDDSISIKSGRDYDGYRVAKPSYNVEVSNCKFYRGYGISIGSEVSGGIKDINIHDNEFNSTDVAFRIKSSKRRGGYIQNISFSNAICNNVKYLIHFYLDWNKEYNNIKLPEGNYPKYYDKIAYIPENFNYLTEVSDILISNVKSDYSADYNGISRIFTIVGYESENIKNILLEKSNIRMKEYGLISNTINFNIKDSNLEYIIDYDSSNDNFDNR